MLLSFLQVEMLMPSRNPRSKINFFIAPLPTVSTTVSPTHKALETHGHCQGEPLTLKKEKVHSPICVQEREHFVASSPAAGFCSSVIFVYASSLTG